MSFRHYVNIDTYHHISAGRFGHATERQPHTDGAAPFQYRADTDIADYHRLRSWEPEFADDRDRPYDFGYPLETWIRDVRRWLAITTIPESKQGFMISLSVGGAARMVLDDLDEDILVNGQVADFGDGQGRILHSGAECIFRTLRLKFPPGLLEARSQTGSESSEGIGSFCPYSGAIWKTMITRFNAKLNKADNQADLQVSRHFKSWLLLTILHLPEWKWIELYEDIMWTPERVQPAEAADNEVQRSPERDLNHTPHWPLLGEEVQYWEKASGMCEEFDGEKYAIRGLDGLVTYVHKTNIVTDAYREGESQEDVQTSYPCYQWEEPEEHLTSTTSDDPQKAVMSTAYGHVMTRIQGKEGILPDTGAVASVTGNRFVRVQGEIARRHGAEVKWTQLDVPKHVGGVGGRAEACRYQAMVPGRLSDGHPMIYCAPVVPTDGNGNESDIPPLVGLTDMARMNVYFGTKLGTVSMVPHGEEPSIKWPEGTRHIQCEKAPSGHWLIIVSDFDAELSTETANMVTSISTQTEGPERPTKSVSFQSQTEGPERPQKSVIVKSTRSTLSSKEVKTGGPERPPGLEEKKEPERSIKDVAPEIFLFAKHLRTSATLRKLGVALAGEVKLYLMSDMKMLQENPATVLWVSVDSTRMASNSWKAVSEIIQQRLTVHT